MKRGILALGIWLMMGFTASIGAYYFEADSNTMALWRFDEGTGDSVYDASGHGNHGKIYGAGWGIGKFGNALYFDGIDDLVEFAHQSGQSNMTNLSIEAWIKPMVLSSGGTGMTILKKWGPLSNNDDVYALQLSSGNTVQAALSNGLGAQTVFNSINTVDTNTWSLVALKWDGDSAFIYINGVRVSSAEYSSYLNSFSTPIYLGRPDPNGTPTEYFKGYVDEIRISKSAVTHYFSSDSNTVALWRFDEGNGDSVYDLSGNGNHGKLNGPSWIAGQFGEALIFDGIDDFVEFSHQTIQSSLSAFKIEAWIKPMVLSSGGTGMTILKKWGPLSNNDDVYALQLSSGNTVQAALSNGLGAQTVFNSINTVDTNTWSLVALKWDGDSAFIYINGVRVSSAEYSSYLNSFSTPIYLGRPDPNGTPTEYFKGYVDEIRISKILPATSPASLLRPTIILPETESEISVNDTILWTSSGSSPSIKYFLQFSLNSSFSQILAEEDSIYDTTFILSQTKQILLFPKFMAIFCRVKGETSAGNISAWSPATSFYLNDRNMSIGKISMNSFPFGRIVVPNPVSLGTKIILFHKGSENISAKVFDCNGRLVRTFYKMNGQQTSAVIEWKDQDDNGRKIRSGFYFLKLNTFDYMTTIRILFIN